VALRPVLLRIVLFSPLGIIPPSFHTHLLPQAAFIRGGDWAKLENFKQINALPEAVITGRKNAFTFHSIQKR